LRWTAAAALASALAGAAAVARPTPAPAPPAEAARVAHVAVDTVFRHADHRGYACVRCHGDGADHGLVLIEAPADCRSCHHALPTAEPCVACHEEDARSDRLFEAVRTLTLPKGATAARALPFRHALHQELACGTCHGEPPARSARGVDCAGCHADHHRDGAECSACHAEPLEAVHPRTVHAGCGGAQCHGDLPFAETPRQRASCLACHRDRADHRAGEECVDCHVMPPAGLRGRVGLAGPGGRR
jgi:hypothetical protein